MKRVFATIVLCVVLLLPATSVNAISPSPVGMVFAIFGPIAMVEAWVCDKTSKPREKLEIEHGVKITIVNDNPVGTKLNGDPMDLQSRLILNKFRKEYSTIYETGKMLLWCGMGLLLMHSPI